MSDGKGILITLEGTEGGGKSTAAKGIARHYEEQGREVLLVREPGGTPLGEGVRTLLFEFHGVMEPRTELLLFLASRSELVAKVIRPALEAGKVVICDRFLDSTLAYQSVLLGLPFGEVLELNDFATGGLYPVATLVMLTDFATAQARMEGRGSGGKYDDLDEDGFWKLYEAYIGLADAFAERSSVIDASGTPDRVLALCLAALAERGLG